jgi:hypothetical protein
MGTAGEVPIAARNLKRSCTATATRITTKFARMNNLGRPTTSARRAISKLRIDAE